MYVANYASPRVVEAVLLVCDAILCLINLLANLCITVEIIALFHISSPGCIRHPSSRFVSVNEFVSYILVILKSTSLRVFRIIVYVKVLDSPRISLK